MFCKNCGNQINEGAAFCSKCGSPIPHVNNTPHPIQSHKSTRSRGGTNISPSKSHSKKLIKYFVPVIIILCILSTVSIVKHTITKVDYSFTVPSEFKKGIGNAHESNQYEFLFNDNCTVHFWAIKDDSKDAHTYLEKKYNGVINDKEWREITNSFNIKDTSIKAELIMVYKGDSDLGANFYFADGGIVYWINIAPKSGGIDSISDESLSAIQNMVINAKKKNKILQKPSSKYYPLFHQAFHQNTLVAKRNKGIFNDFHFSNLVYKYVPNTFI